MAATEMKNIWPVASSDGVAVELEHGQIAASQGILMPNSPMYLSTAGTWKVSETTDTSGEPFQGLFAGLGDASATWPITAALAADTDILVHMIDPDDTYKVFIENNGTDAAALQTYVGEQYGLTVSATAGEVGYTTMDVNNANATVKVVDIEENRTYKGDLTTAPGVAYVKFLAAASTQAGERA